MKICIVGHSGSGKSTLAKNLASYYNIPVLHMDAYQFLPGWKARDKEEFKNIVADFLNENDDWVIDGNYLRITPERFQLADMIIYLDFNRFFCLKSIISRYRKYKGKTRNDMAEGCLEKLDFEFIKWVLFKGRSKAKKQYFSDLISNADIGLIFKNRRQLVNYLRSFNIDYEI
jgi:adenylate kinase family enzyme